MNSALQSGGVGSHLVIMVDDELEDAPLMVRGSLVLALFESIRASRGEEALEQAISSAEDLTETSFSAVTKLEWYPIKALAVVMEEAGGLPEDDWSWAREVAYRGIMESTDPSLKYLVENSGMMAILREMSETWPSMMSHGSVRTFETERSGSPAGSSNVVGVRRVRTIMVRMLYVHERPRLACSIMIGMIEALLHRTCGTRPGVRELKCLGKEDEMCEYEVTL